MSLCITTIETFIQNNFTCANMLKYQKNYINDSCELPLSHWSAENFQALEQPKFLIPVGRSDPRNLLPLDRDFMGCGS